MTKTNIARMTWPEVDEAVKRNAVAMLPLAAIEPSGRHSVMGGEIHVADYFVQGVAERTSSVWVPTMPFGYGPNFMGFPGAVTLKPATLEAVILDVCRSLLGHGFDHILVVDNHSGNEPVLEQAARAFRQETGVTLASILLPPIMRTAASDLYEDLSKVRGHGGEPGVSVRLYLTPDDMRLDLAEESTRVRFQGLDISGTTVKQGSGTWTFYADYHEVHPSGGTGIPFDADAERGRVILERMVDYGVEVIEAFRHVDTRLRTAHVSTARSSG